jgi:DNA-binding NarL/FixJ family response regulator
MPCTVHDARDTAEAETLVVREHWDLVVFDLSVVDQPGMGSLSRVREAIGAETPLIAVGMHPEVEFARSALDAGADAFLLAERVDEDLIETVRHVRRGEALMNGRSTA